MCNHISNENLGILLKEWRTGLDTQMHFNELIIRNRTLVITIGTGFIGALADATKLALDETTVFFASLAVSIFFVITFLIDFFYYYQMLKGAVEFTAEIDAYIKAHPPPGLKNVPLFGLTEKITKEVEGGAEALGCVSGFLIWVYYGLPFSFAVSMTVLNFYRVAVDC
jgi:hypothetical protein